MPKKQNKKAKPKKEDPAEQTKALDTIIRSASMSKPIVVIRKVMYVNDHVPAQYSFYLNDGRVLRSLNDLIKALDTMSDEIFSYHANSSKNDFSSWIKDIIREHELAMNILGKNRIHTKEEIIRFLKRRGSTGPLRG